MMRHLASKAYTRYLLPALDPARYRGLAQRLALYRQREKLSLDENLRLQWISLKGLLEYAYSSSPFYRRRFDEAGIRPQDIKSPSDLAKIPPLTRVDISDHLSELTSRRYRLEMLRRSATGGTTDTPVPFLADFESMREKTAIQLRFQAWAGLLPGDKVFYLWGARSDFVQNPSWRWRLFDRHVMRRVWAPTSLFNEQVLESYHHTLNAFRPQSIYAYPTPLTLLCEYLRDNQHDHHRPSSIVCTAEKLLPQQRALIQEVMQCPVFEHYGAREFGMVAAECERHLGLHVNPAAAYAEYVPLQRAGTEGLYEILVTDLLNYGMPLIRYRVNDCALADPGECPCGRGYPLMQQVVGRTTDNFYLPNGDVVPGLSLTNRVIRVCPGLKKIQVIQDTFESFRVSFVPGPNFSPADLTLLQKKLDEFFGKSVRWQFKQVNEIEREASGKTRFCISHVGRPSRDQCRVMAEN